MGGRWRRWLLVAIAWGSMGVPEVAAQQDDRFAAHRNVMVSAQIAGRDVRSADVLRVMRKVPRHEFVPEGAKESAYLDHPLSIGYGQTISQPYIVAFMTEQLDLKPEHKVLEIGTGSGYQAAVLAELAGEVFTIEIVEPLGRRAEETLSRLGYDNIHVRIGNGYLGWPEEAPFDRVILTAAPKKLPESLVEQLAPGGRLVAPVGPLYGNQEIIVLDKDKNGKVRRRSVLPVRFVPMVAAPGDPGR